MYYLCLLEPDLAAFDLSSWRIAGAARRCRAGLVGDSPSASAPSAHERLRRDRDHRGVHADAARSCHRPPGDSAGQAGALCRSRIMDEAGREVAPGEAGEIWIKGPTVVPGYLANDTATRASFVAGFWRSGDVGAIDEAGYVQVLDRLKDMINRAGYKVFSAEVESVLQRPSADRRGGVGRATRSGARRGGHAFVTARGPGPDARRRAGLLPAPARRFQGAGVRHHRYRAVVAQRARQAAEGLPPPARGGADAMTAAVITGAAGDLGQALSRRSLPTATGSTAVTSLRSSRAPGSCPFIST